MTRPIAVRPPGRPCRPACRLAWTAPELAPFAHPRPAGTPSAARRAAHREVACGGGREGAVRKESRSRRRSWLRSFASGRAPARTAPGSRGWTAAKARTPHPTARSWKARSPWSPRRRSAHCRSARCRRSCCRRSCCPDSWWADSRCAKPCGGRSPRLTEMFRRPEPGLPRAAWHAGSPGPGWAGRSCWSAPAHRPPTGRPPRRHVPAHRGRRRGPAAPALPHAGRAPGPTATARRARVPWGAERRSPVRRLLRWNSLLPGRQRAPPRHVPRPRSPAPAQRFLTRSATSCAAGRCHRQRARPTPQGRQVTRPGGPARAHRVGRAPGAPARRERPGLPSAPHPERATALRGGWPGRTAQRTDRRHGQATSTAAREDGPGPEAYPWDAVRGLRALRRSPRPASPYARCFLRGRVRWLPAQGPGPRYSPAARGAPQEAQRPRRAHRLHGTRRLPGRRKPEETPETGAGPKHRPGPRARETAGKGPEPEIPPPGREAHPPGPAWPTRAGSAAAQRPARPNWSAGPGGSGCAAPARHGGPSGARRRPPAGRASRAAVRSPRTGRGPGPGQRRRRRPPRPAATTRAARSRPRRVRRRASGHHAAARRGRRRARRARATRRRTGSARWRAGRRSPRWPRRAPRSGRWPAGSRADRSSRGPQPYPVRWPPVRSRRAPGRQRVPSRRGRRCPGLCRYGPGTGQGIP